MTHHRAFNWLLAGIIAILLGSVYRLDGPTDHSAEMALSASLQEAIKNEATKARFELAAAQMCGNAEWTQDADGAVVCKVRKVRARAVSATQIAQVQP